MNFKTIAADVLNAVCLVTFAASSGFLVAHVLELSQRPVSCPTPIITQPISR